MNDLQVEVLNGLQGDPAVYAFIRTSGEALLFDLGMLDQISQRDLMKVRHVFVSHTHMDHFMGFDRWLRVNIPHKRLLKIWGPAPFFERVQARLRSYSWNLIAPDQLRFEVHELRPDGSVATALLTNTDFFAIHEEEALGSQDELTVLADGSILSTVALDHNNIVSLAYKFRSPDKLRFLHEELPGLGLTSGSWIGQLQIKVKHALWNEPTAINGKFYPTRELAEKLLRTEEGDSLVYLTDLSFDRKNVKALRNAFGKSKRMICESSFLDQDRPRAVAKAHLTTRQAALIAMALEVEDFQIFHVSTIYGQGAEASLAEAQSFFRELTGLDGKDREEALEAEFLAVEELKSKV
jgi:ribonuclease Z